MHAKLPQSCLTLQSYGLQPNRLLCSQDSLGKNKATVPQFKKKRKEKKTNTTLHHAKLFSNHSGKRLSNTLLKQFQFQKKQICLLMQKKKCPEVSLGRRKGGILQIMGLEDLNLKESKICYTSASKMTLIPQIKMKYQKVRASQVAQW